jgi:hypothetical protein
MQYTLRRIPAALDKALRERAKKEGKSLNEVTVAALADGLGLGASDVVRRDLSDVVGTWKRDAAVERALAAQDRVDENLWK